MSTNFVAVFQEPQIYWHFICFTFKKLFHLFVLIARHKTQTFFTGPSMKNSDLLALRNLYEANDYHNNWFPCKQILQYILFNHFHFAILCLMLVHEIHPIPEYRTSLKPIFRCLAREFDSGKVFFLILCTNLYLMHSWD